MPEFTAHIHTLLPGLRSPRKHIRKQNWAPTEKKGAGKTLVFFFLTPRNVIKTGSAGKQLPRIPPPLPTLPEQGFPLAVRMHSAPWMSNKLKEGAFKPNSVISLQPYHISGGQLGCMCLLHWKMASNCEQQDGEEKQTAIRLLASLFGY